MMPASEPQLFTYLYYLKSAKLRVAAMPLQPIPVLLLKTKSSPGDAYEELLSSHSHDAPFAPRFVPVLSHRFDDQGLETLHALLRGRRIGSDPGCEFGGVIFTSQRAVEAFAHVVREGQDDPDPGWPHLQDVPIYSVGPATTRAIAALSNPPPQIFGSHTGNGEALANFILAHYSEWHTNRQRPRTTLPALLFPVGEQRRDIIPRTLMSETLPRDQRIPVVEEVVYGTGVMESFPGDLAAALRDTQASASRWVVVFSATGCAALLGGLGLLDSETGRYVGASGLEGRERRDGRTFVATIGPTTRDHLVDRFGFEPDVCAESPSPEGVVQGILAFEARRKQLDDE